MLWKEVGRSRDAIAAGFGDIVQMAFVGVLRQAEEPGVEAVGPQRGTSVGIFIDDGLGARGEPLGSGSSRTALRGFCKLIGQDEFVSNGED
jgi:hypothetical protein